MFNKVYRALKSPRKICLVLLNFFSKIIPDKQFLQIKYYLVFKRKLNFDNPQTYNEKIQWLKLFNRNPKYTIMVDKYLVRDYVKQKIGEQYLVPLLGVWKNSKDINFEKLPNQFVIKCNHNSGLGMCICKEKNSLDYKKVKKKLQKGLQQDYYLTAREWPYKNVPRRIIAEQFLFSENNDQLLDYKFMCFNGKVKCIFVCSGRNTPEGLHVTFFDSQWNLLPFERHYPRNVNGFPKPERLEEMITLAEILARDIPFVRVDFYYINNKIYFGELTFFPGAGFEEFTPPKWDYTLGSWIKLPRINPII